MNLKKLRQRIPSTQNYPPITMQKPDGGLVEFRASNHGISDSEVLRRLKALNQPKVVAASHAFYTLNSDWSLYPDTQEELDSDDGHSLVSYRKSVECLAFDKDKLIGRCGYSLNFMFSLNSKGNFKSGILSTVDVRLVFLAAESRGLGLSEGFHECILSDYVRSLELFSPYLPRNINVEHEIDGEVISESGEIFIEFLCDIFENVLDLEIPAHSGLSSKNINFSLEAIADVDY